jgi:hypothetical protein
VNPHYQGRNAEVPNFGASDNVGVAQSPAPHIYIDSYDNLEIRED